MKFRGFWYCFFPLLIKVVFQESLFKGDVRLGYLLFPGLNFFREAKAFLQDRHISAGTAAVLLRFAMCALFVANFSRKLKMSGFLPRRTANMAGILGKELSPDIRISKVFSPSEKNTIKVPEFFNETSIDLIYFHTADNPTVSINFCL